MKIATAGLLLALLLPLSAAAAPPPPEYGGSWTDGELAAIDRALHAANMTRKDLIFRKDLTEGHGCLPDVRAMMEDPLRIPAFMDRFVARVQGASAEELAVARAAAALAPGLPPVSPGAPPSSLTTPEKLLGWLEPYSAPNVDLMAAFPGLDEEDLRLLRRYLPPEMDWHEVFPSPFDEATTARLKAERKERGDAWLHEAGAKIDLGRLAKSWLLSFGGLPAWLRQLPPDAFPNDAPKVLETSYGRIAIGTAGDDVYTGDYVILIDPGGDDRYVNCRIGAGLGPGYGGFSLFADLGGDDVYECGDVDLTLGAAVLGIAAFYDLGAGNDRYVGGHGTMGAAFGGIAVLYDDGGSDTYEGKTFTQGAAGFGIGILYDDSVQDPPKMTTDEGTPDPVDTHAFDNDRLTAWANAQAFARARSVALCVNRRGNDTYEAGGVYLDAPLFSDRYQSFSQGFAIGERGIDWAGGIALLADFDGNDRYLGDIYDQGVGYWYSAGLLYDGGGNDLYEMTQYGQGSGIHLAVGGLVDAGGNDAYVMHSGLGQGGSHDYAASVFQDRGGDDRYLGMTSCNGCGLTNSVGIFSDRSGNDTYAGRRNGGMNAGRPARGFASIGILVDLGGKDDYLGIMKDETAWRDSDIGVGVDVAGGEAGGNAAGPSAPTGKAEIPDVCSYEGSLTEEVFDELWAIAIRWEVGDNRTIVPKARERIAAFGPAVLPMMDAKMEESASGLELRAYVDVLGKLREAGADAAVTDFLRRNLASEVERRKKVALYLTGEMKMASLEGEVASILVGGNDSLALRAAGVLRALGSHAGDGTLLDWLDSSEDEFRLQAALGTLLGLETECYDSVRLLLDHPLMSVRTRLATLLAEHASAYAAGIRTDVRGAAPSPRALRTLLDVLVRAKLPPEKADATAVAQLLANDDWGVRADAARVIRRWERLDGTDAAILEPALDALVTAMETETDPYVRFCARPAD